MCEQQYFIEYVLGRRGLSNKKADKGTIVHKVLEILAIMKKAQQDKIQIIEDDIVGTIDLNTDDMFNDQFILSLANKVYDYYTSQCSHHSWLDKDRKDCIEWISKTLRANNRMFDPRRRNIFRSEQHFDLVINKDWANYIYDINGKKISGKLAIKGTMDLITQIDDNTLEIVDWKTGRRLNWATGEEKTQAKLEDDPQLRLYHYAVHRLFPEFKHIIVTINFINDGGPFSVCFDNTDNAMKTEYMLKEKFIHIQKTQKPQLKKSWMCSKLCHFGKNTFQNDKHVLPTIEYRDNQITPKNNFMTQCEQIKHDLELRGMNEAVDVYQLPGYSVGTYKAPGEV
jgi:hypothetical protein